MTNNYKVKLATSGKEYKEEGKTIVSALDKMGLEWQHIKSKGMLNVELGDKSHEHLFSCIQLRRLFGNKLRRALWAKRIKYLMK